MSATARTRRRRSSRPAPTPAPAPPLPQPPLSAPISKAGGPFPVDMARAQADARTVLNSIDWSKRDIVIWVPGTSNHHVHPAFEAAVRDSWRNGGVSLTRLDYEATWNLRPSAATGIATLKLVLAGIAAHGGNHNVMLAGESQGSWIIGEAIADPMLRRVVDRAVLMGHPYLAAHHYEDGRDPAIMELNHAGDMVAMPVKGDPTVALDAMIAIRTLKLWKVPTMLRALIENPAHAVKLLGSVASALPFVKEFIKDPHNYSNEMTRVVEFLRFGRTSDGTSHEADEVALRRRAAAAALGAAALGAAA